VKLKDKAFLSYPSLADVSQAEDLRTQKPGSMLSKINAERPSYNI